MRALSLAPGVRATAGAASSTTAIPNDSSGSPAKYVAIRALTASETAAVLPVQNGGSVTASNGLPVSKEQPVILAVAGYSHIATIRFAAADVALNIIPVENY